MQNAAPDYEKLYRESLEKLARAEELISGYQEQVNGHQEQTSNYQEQVTLLTHQVSSYEQQIQLLRHELNGLRRKVFGSITDNQVQRALEAGQLDLFTLGAPAQLQQQAEEVLKQDITQQNAGAEKKARRTTCRMVLPQDMERQEVIIDPQADLSAYHVIGEEVTEILVHVPGCFKIKKIIRRKWALNNSADIGQKGVLIAPIPSRTVRRGLFDESVLAQLLTGKYVDHLTLYRQQKILSGQASK